MEYGETFEEAVRREIMEEYCVEAEEVRQVTAVNVLREHEGSQTHWIAVLHAVKVNPKGIMIGEPNKMDEIGWFHPDEFPEERHSMLDRHFNEVKDHI